MISFSKKQILVFIGLFLLASCSSGKRQTASTITVVPQTSAQISGSTTLTVTGTAIPTVTPVPTPTSSPSAVSVQGAVAFGDIFLASLSEVLLSINANTDGISVVSVQTANPFLLSGCPVGKVLPCTLRISIDPKATAGRYQENLNIGLSNGQILQIPVAVNLLAPGNLVAIPSAVDLGSILTGPQETIIAPVTLNNTGSPLKILSISASYPFIISGCPTGETLKDNCVLKVAVIPSSPVGQYQGQVTVVTDTAQVLRIPVSISVIQASAIAASPSSGELRSDLTKYTFTFNLAPATTGQPIRIKSVSVPSPFTLSGCAADQIVGSIPCVINAIGSTPKGSYTGNIDFVFSSGQTLSVPFKLAVKDYMVNAYVTHGMNNCAAGYTVASTADLNGYCTFNCGGMSICVKYAPALEVPLNSKVVSTYWLTAQGLHIVGSPGCGADTLSGGIADCYGNRCYGNRGLCVRFQNY